MALYVNVRLRIDSVELERLGLDEDRPETQQKIAEGVLARVYPVAGCDPEEFVASAASVRVQRERATVVAEPSYDEQPNYAV